MACDAATLIATAYSNGYAKLSDRDLRMATLASACAGGGGGSSAVSCGDGAPIAAPASGCGLYIDNLTGDLWKFYSGAWH